MGALIKCKACGGEVARTAKACPKCGAPPDNVPTWGKVALGGAVLVAAIGVCAARDKGDSKAPVEKASSSPSQVAPKPPPDPEPAVRSPAEVVAEAKTLDDALDVATALMSDTTNEHSMGLYLLASWSSKHMTWADVGVAKNETSTALVQKDSDAARGKRMCVSGEIIQISKTGDLFSGLLITSSYSIVSFFAVGSTGELVAQSHARFCGVVTGRFDYSNSGGGTGHAVDMVGMFNLPENK